MKSLHLTLRFTQFHRGREAFADGLSVNLARQTEVRAVTGLVGLMTTTVWLSATTVDGGDGATAKITQFQDLHEDAGTLLFEGGEGVRQRASPILTYTYVRIISTKKETRRIRPCGSPTPDCRTICLFRMGGLSEYQPQNFYTSSLKIRHPTAARADSGGGAETKAAHAG
jgi:hypothetical protein